MPDNVSFIVLITSAVTQHASVSQERCNVAPLPDQGHIISSFGHQSFDEKALGIEREPRPNVRVGIPARHDVRDLLDALSLDRHPESGTPAAYLYRNLYHLAHSDSS